MEKVKKKNLALFFTLGVSLEVWEKRGMLERELSLYKELSKNLENIYFITYGFSDAKYQKKLKKYNIIVLPKKYNIPNFLYSLIIPFVYKKELKKVNILKTNQMLGSWSAVFVKWFFKTSLILRTGYTLSLFSLKESKLKYFVSKIIEWFGLTFADKVIVATIQEKEYFAAYKEKVVTTPNYVETELFLPKEEAPTGTKLVFVGRMSAQKNLKTLFEAMKEIPQLFLTIVGSGELEKELKELAKSFGLSVNFLGPKPHSELPKIIHEADWFVFPSLYEGNPKALLEAMACAMPILTTKVEGIDNIIEHKKQAIMVEPTVEGLKKGLEELVSMSNDDAKQLGINAKKYIDENASLKSIVKKELSVYEMVLENCAVQ